MLEKMTLQDAVRKVLTEAQEELHYKEIASIIAAENLVERLGATPDKSVAATISLMRSAGEEIERPKRAYYKIATPPVVTDADEDAEVEDNASVRIAAYGLYWERDKVEWDVSGNKIELLGRPYGAPGSVVNFADQQGIYLLHQMQSVTYVGRTTAGNNGLFSRLKDHSKNTRRVGRWDRFSWFGIRPVHEDGELLNAPSALTTDLFVTILEAVLIETHLPPFNDKSGDMMGQLYDQVLDPDIAKNKANELLRDALGHNR